MNSTLIKDITINKSAYEFIKAKRDKKRKIDKVLKVLRYVLIILAVCFFSERVIFVFIGLAFFALIMYNEGHEKELHLFERGVLYCELVLKGGLTQISDFEEYLTYNIVPKESHNDKVALIYRDVAELYTKKVFIDSSKSVEAYESDDKVVEKVRNKTYDENGDIFSDNNVSFIKPVVNGVLRVSKAKMSNEYIRRIFLGIGLFCFMMLLLLLYFTFENGTDGMVTFVYQMPFLFGGVAFCGSNFYFRKKENFWLRAEKYLNYIKVKDAKNLEEIVEFVPEELFKKEKNSKVKVARDDFEKLIKAKYIVVNKV